MEFSGCEGRRDYWRQEYRSEEINRQGRQYIRK